MPKFNPIAEIRSLVPEAGPKRLYALATFINMFGFGLLVVSMSLYFTRIVGLPASQVGAALTIGVLISLISGVPVGNLADRWSPLKTVKVMLVIQAATATYFIFVDNFTQLVIAATLDMLAMKASVAASESLLRRVAGDDAVSFRGKMHAIQFVAMGLGTAGAGIVIAIGTPGAYQVMIALDALSFLGALVVFARMADYEPLPKPETASRWGVFADRPFVVYTAVAGAMNLQLFMINMLLPLWVVEATKAPSWTVALFYILNNTLIVLFMVRVGNKVKTIQQGGNAIRRAGVILLFSCSAIGFANGLPGWAAVILLLVAVCVHTYGELWYMAGSFALNFGLPPAHAQGQYMGFLGTGAGIGEAFAPLLFLSFILTLGRPGLIGIGVFFALVGLLAPAVARWGERTRPAPEESTTREVEPATAE
ncbi:MFS transporter [Micromonospora sp. NPDC049645]|uniref:MFS transporter n=1 Tax=Micromonospora sp. NPDC049645 TaxID=3155508 RepID=UPI003437D8DD